MPDARARRPVFLTVALFGALSLGSSSLGAEVRELSIETPTEGVTIAGTLTLPDTAEGGVPGVLLLSGSGPQDRDGTVFGKTPQKTLARVLTKRGFAVLRVDDRGTSSSTGDFASATIDDFVVDARAALRALAQEEGVDWKRLFVIGHSEGAAVGAELGASGDVSGGLVLLGGAALPGHEILTDQAIRIARAAGAPEERLEKVEPAHRALMRALLEDADEEVLRERLDALIDAQTGGTMPEQFRAMSVEQALPQMQGAWFRRFLEHDPSDAIQRTGVPILAIYGTLDQQVSDELNVAPMTEAIQGAGNPDSRVLVVPGRNHLFQRARTGGVDEYARLPGDLDEDVAHSIATWIDGLLQEP